MKQSVALLLSIFFALTVHAQNFEGKIMYQNTMKSRMPNVSDEQWNSMLGTKQEYFIKGGDYRSVSNGSLVQWQLYKTEDNKLYNKLSNSETLTWIDGNENKDSVLDFKWNKNVTEILGNKCDELILICKSGSQKYYFSSKYKIDSKLFSNHKYGNWYYYLSKTNAVPLKQIIETPQFILESSAVEIVPMQLQTDIYNLPAQAKMVKSPY